MYVLYIVECMLGPAKKTASHVLSCALIQRGPCEKDREPIVFEHECNVNNKQFIDTCLCVYY
jgi:hypothetical protein